MHHPFFLPHLMALGLTCSTTFAGLHVSSIGKHYSPAPNRVPIRQTVADHGGSTSVRNVDAEHLTWKSSGYYQRNRDLGQVFSPQMDFRLDAVVLRTGPSDSAVKTGAPGAPLFIQFFEVTGHPTINQNETPPGSDAKHGFSTNHRCDDFMEGVTYEPLAIVTGGHFPGLPPTKDINDQPTHQDNGKLHYLRWDLIGTDELLLQAGKRYAFMVGITEPGPARAFTLANHNAASATSPPSLDDTHNQYPGGWGLRREGAGTLPPTMQPTPENAPPTDFTTRRQLIQESLFGTNDERYALSPTTDGYPDVDTYRDLEFYLEIRNPSPPNVLLIFTDDQGSIDLNCYGATDLRTPHLDQLASQGTRFTQFYVAAPVCSPSRAALLTGRYPQRAGVPGNVSSQPGGSGLPTDQVTIAEMMQQAGYATGHIGKWHLGYTPETMPNAQGFDYSFGHMGGCIDNYSHFFYWRPPNRHDLWRNGKEVWHDGTFFGDLMVEECKRFIDHNRTRPFFVYWAINMPHYPLQGTSKWRAIYRDLEEPRRQYAEFVSTLDAMIGQVLNHLDATGLRKNTIVIFLSDHGHSVEDRTFGGGGDSGPYRGHKFTLWEGGIRVPCIVSWPNHIPTNEVRNQIAISLDWLPTIAHYTGAPLPDRKIDGQNIAPIIHAADTPSPHSTLHWETSNGKHWAVRNGSWKLVHRGPTTTDQGRQLPAVETFLSDLNQDVSETTNAAQDHPDLVDQLTQLHQTWAAEVQQ